MAKEKTDGKGRMQEGRAKSCVYSVSVTDDTGRDIATALITGCKISMPG